MHFLVVALFCAAVGKHQTPPDSTYLIFTLEKDIVTVRLLHWSATSKSTADLNRFVNAHLSEIDPNKIVIYGESNAKYPDFKPIIEVMKKHDWMKFKLMIKGEHIKQPEGETVFINQKRSTG